MSAVFIVKNEEFCHVCRRQRLLANELIHTTRDRATAALH